MGRAHRQSNGHGVNGITSGTSAAALASAEVMDMHTRKMKMANGTRINTLSETSDTEIGLTKRTSLLGRCWKPFDSILMDMFGTIGDRFLIPHTVASVPSFVDKELLHRQGALNLVGHLLTIITLMASAAYLRRLNNLMNGASPVMGEILFCVSHLSQVTQEQLGWGLFSSGFLSPSAFDWATLESSGNGGVPISNRGGGHAVRRQTPNINDGTAPGGNTAFLGLGKSSVGVGGDTQGPISRFTYTGGHLVRYFLGRKTNDMIRYESLRSYLYCSFYSPSAFLVEQTVWFVVLAATLDLISLQRLTVAAFFANVLGWLPVYSIKSLAGLGVALVVVFMYWIPSYEVDEAVMSAAPLNSPLYRVLSGYCASLCITLLFAETLLLEDARRTLVQNVLTLPQRLLQVAGHHPVVISFVHGCIRLRCEYLYFVNFYFFLGMMCWISLVLMETTVGISIFGTAALLFTLPMLIGNGWIDTPLRALKDTVVYLSFYGLTAYALAHVVPSTGWAFLSNAVQSVAVLFLMAARCECKQPGGSVYLLLLVAMMSIYLYEKSTSTRRATPSLGWSGQDYDSPVKLGNSVRALFYSGEGLDMKRLGFIHVAYLKLSQLFSRGFSEEGILLIHLNVVVLGAMLLFTTTIRALFVETVRVTNPPNSASSPAEATGVSATAWSVAATAFPVFANNRLFSGKVAPTSSVAQVPPGQNSRLRSLSNSSQSGATTAPLPGKIKLVPQAGGTKALPASTPGIMKRPWQVQPQPGVMDINSYTNSDGNHDAAQLRTTDAETISALCIVQEEKPTGDLKESDKLVKHFAQEKESRQTAPTTPLTPGETAVESTAVLETPPRESDRSPMRCPTDSHQHTLKGGEKQKELRSSFSSAPSASTAMSVVMADEARQSAKKRCPCLTSDSEDNGTEVSVPVPWGKSGANICEESHTSLPGENEMNKGTFLASTMSHSVTSVTTPTNRHHEEAASVIHHSGTPSDTRSASPRRLSEHQKEHAAEQSDEQDLVQARTPPDSAALSNCPLAGEDLKQQHQSLASSRDQRNLREIAAPKRAPVAPVLKQQRSQSEELERVVDTLATASLSTPSATPIEKAEVGRRRSSIPDATVPLASAAKPIKSKAPSGPGGAVLSAVPAEKSVTPWETKRANGKAKAVAGKNGANCKAPAVAASAAIESVSSPVVSPPKAVILAERRADKKATVPTLPAKESALNTAKSAAVSATPSETAMSEESTKTSASQLAASLPTVFSPSLLRSAKVDVDEDDSVMPQKSLSSGEGRPGEPLRRAWREVQRANAVSSICPVMTPGEPVFLSAGEPKSQSKSKSSVVATVEEEEDCDAAYDLDRVLQFLQLKRDCAADVDDVDGEHQRRSNSTFSGEGYSHDPTSFGNSDMLVPAEYLPLTKTHARNRSTSAAADPDISLTVFSTALQPSARSSSPHGSFAAANLSSSGSLVDITQRVSHPSASASEWIATGGTGIDDSNAELSASFNCISTNASGTFASPGAVSSCFHVFSTHPHAGGVSKTTTGSLSPHPPSTFTGISSHGSTQMHPGTVEVSVEHSAATRQRDFNAPNTLLSYYQNSQAAASPPPAMESLLCSSSHVPFGISAVNVSSPPMPSLSSFGQGDTTNGIERSAAVSRRHVPPKVWVSSAEQVEKHQQQPAQGPASATTMQQMQSSPPGLQQTMMMMMRTPDGQMAFYPMLYKQPVYMVDPNAMMQHAHPVQMAPHPQQQQMMYAVSSQSSGYARPIAYQILPDGTCVPTALQMSQQMMSQYPQQ